MATPLTILLEAEDKASQAYRKTGASITDAINSVMATTKQFEAVSEELDNAMKMRAETHAQVTASLDKMAAASPAVKDRLEELAVQASEGAIGSADSVKT